MVVSHALISRTLSHRDARMTSADVIRRPWALAVGFGAHIDVHRSKRRSNGRRRIPLRGFEPRFPP
jgi:hypothetical protein